MQSGSNPASAISYQVTFCSCIPELEHQRKFWVLLGGDERGCRCSLQAPCNGHPYFELFWLQWDLTQWGLGKQQHCDHNVMYQAAADLPCDHHICPLTSRYSILKFIT